MGPSAFWCLKFSWLIALALFPAADKPSRLEVDEHPRNASAPNDPAAAKEALRLSEILKQWEQHSNKRARLDCRFKRYRYDKTFSIEYRGEGQLALDRAGRAAYVLSPTKVPPRAAGRKRNADGELFSLRADEAQRWYWTDTEVIRVDDDNRSMEVCPREGSQQRTGPARERTRPLPPELPHDPLTTRVVAWGDQPSDWLLCLLLLCGGGMTGPTYGDFFLPETLMLGASAETLQQEFHVTRINETDTEIFLKLRPKNVPRNHHLQMARLMLEKKSFMPMAIMYTSPDGSEVVHRFLDVQMSGPEGPSQPVHFPDLGAPDLSGLRKVELATP